MPDQTVTRDHPDYRAAVVAGVRELADFIERNTDLPVPQAVSAQYSEIYGSFADAAQLVHDAAEAMGVKPDIDEDFATAKRDIASGGYPSPLPLFRVTYTVFGSREIAADPTGMQFSREPEATEAAPVAPGIEGGPVGRAARNGGER